MTTRKELIAAIGERYRAAPKADKAKILDEFTRLTGYHRKHAIRVLNGTTAESPVTTVAPRNRIYDEAVRQALIVLWEAGDRVCDKRLKVMIPLLIHAMENCSTRSNVSNATLTSKAKHAIASIPRQ
jgi:hypothetical protein